MINFRNIVKIVLMAMFICALSSEVWAQNKKQALDDFVKRVAEIAKDQAPLDPHSVRRGGTGQTAKTGTTNTGAKNGKVLDLNNKSDFLKWEQMTLNKINEDELRKFAVPESTRVSIKTGDPQLDLEWAKRSLPVKDPESKTCNPPCAKGQRCDTNLGVCVVDIEVVQNAAQNVVGAGAGGEVDGNFCDGSFGIFTELVRTGQLIFQRLRDLIYVAAGFGIIAVAVGGFFGNLNWKWLGAIVISLVVIATAGELIVLVTGCEQFSTTLITNTLTNPTAMSTAQYQGTYTEDSPEVGTIQWNDKYALDHPDTYAGTKAEASSEEYDDSFLEGYDVTSDTQTILGENE